jgi:hypothetical protein
VDGRSRLTRWGPLLGLVPAMATGQHGVKLGDGLFPGAVISTRRESLGRRGRATVLACVAGRRVLDRGELARL